MRTIFIFLSLVFLIACQSAEEKKPTTANLNPAITEIVAFMADSAANCAMWLHQDNEIRRFFTENDSLANYLTNYFDHDQILSWYQSVDSTTQIDLSAYLYQLDVPYVTHLDSLNATCAAAINALAFSHDGNEALVLYMEFASGSEKAYTLLLEQPAEGGWYVADTLSVSHQEH